jgi:hypothetical protein
MENPITNSLLAIILQAEHEDLFKLTLESDSRLKADAPPMSFQAICNSIKHEVPVSFDEFELSPNDEREDKQAEFLCNMSASRIEWVEEVKQTHWDRFDYKTKASYLFMTAESLGISGTASFAILAASMALRGFKVPNDLNKQLWAAKRNSQQQLKELMDAEKRREAELKKQK